MDSTNKAKIQQSIALLEQVLGGKSDSSNGPTMISIPGFDQEISKFSKIGSKLQPEIQQLILISAVDSMKKIMSYSTICKKFTGKVQQDLKDMFRGFKKQTDNVYKNADYSYHVKAIRELIEATFWIFSTMPQITIKGGSESADFNARKFQKLKNQDHNQWWKAVSNAFKTLMHFIKQTYQMGLLFNFNGKGNWQDIFQGQGPSKVTQQKKHHQQSKKVQISKAQGKKQPKKQVQGLNWFIGNFEKQQIILSSQEISMKQGIYVESCNGCVIKVEGKFKSLNMNGSKDISLVVNKSLSGVQVMNCEDVRLYVRGNTPSISVEKCQKVRIIFSQDNLLCDIVSSKVSEFNISYTKENGDEAKDYTVSQQLISKWNPTKKSFETNIYDQFL